VGLAKVKKSQNHFKMKSEKKGLAANKKPASTQEKKRRRDVVKGKKEHVLPWPFSRKSRPTKEGLWGHKKGKSAGACEKSTQQLKEGGLGETKKKMKKGKEKRPLAVH